MFALGAATVMCTGTDDAGNTATKTFTVTVSDQDDPQVTVTAPVDGATVRGVVDLTATATDLVGVTEVEFSVDGTPMGATDTTAPYTRSWDSSTAGQGAHVVRAVASDAAGHSTVSAPVTVNVPAPGVPLVWHSAGGSGALWKGSETSSPAQRIFTGDALDPSWSPDRDRVAFASNRDGNYDIWLLEVATGSLSNLTRTATGFNDEPDWSPDGTRVAFSSNRDGDYEVYTIRIDGSGLRQVTSNSVGEYEPAWSPDAARILFVDSDLDLALIRPDGSGRRIIAATPEYEEKSMLGGPDTHFDACRARTRRRTARINPWTWGVVRMNRCLSAWQTRRQLIPLGIAGHTTSPLVRWPSSRS